MLVARAVARGVEGGEAGGVLAEFVGPEVRVGLGLRDPEGVHVGEEVEAAVEGEEGADVGAGVGGYGCAVGEARGGVWGGDGVVLAG